MGSFVVPGLRWGIGRYWPIWESSSQRVCGLIRRHPWEFVGAKAPDNWDT